MKVTKVVRRQLLLAVGEDKTPATEFRIFASGINESTKGPIVCDADACAMVMGRYRKRGLDKLPFDAGHGMAYGTDHRAYGWFVPDQNGGELWATKIKWNQIALDAFADSQFRFFSPWCMVGYEDGRVKELINIALTNIPASNNQKPLVASRSREQVPVQLSAEPEKEEDEMDPEVLKLLGALNCTAVSEIGPKVKALADHTATLSTQVATLTAQNATLTTEKTALEGKVTELSSSTENARRDALIVTLSTGDGAKLPPSMHAWAQSQTFDQLTAWSKVTPVLLGSQKVETKSPALTPAVGVESQEVLRQFGLLGSEDKYNEMQAHLATHGGVLIPSMFKPATVQNGKA